MNDRLRELRKHLDLTQTEFGERLGVKNAAISKIEKGENRLSEQMLALICRVYNVNEDWLRHGKGEIFAPALSEEIEKVVQKHGWGDVERQLLTLYAELNEDERARFQAFARELGRRLSEEPKKE